MEKIIPFIIIDKDENTQTILKKLIERAFPYCPVVIFNNDSEGWRYLQNQNGCFVILANIAFVDNDEFNILKQIKSNSKFKDAYFILINSRYDKDINIKILQQGADECLNKPFSSEDLFAKLRNAYRVTSLNAEIVNLNNAFQDMRAQLMEYPERIKKIIHKFQMVRIPGSENIIQWVTNAAVWIAKEYEESSNPNKNEEDEKTLIDEKRNQIIEEAAKFCFAGKLFLPENLLMERVTSNGFPKNDKMAQIPANAKELLSNIDNFKEVIDIIYHIYENFDGSGFPDKQKSWQIPVGSRILRVILDFEELFLQKKHDNSKIINMLEHENKRLYDHKAVALLDQYLATKSLRGKVQLEKPVALKELQEGMIISRSINTNSGFKLMAAGTYLTQDKIDKIISLTASDSIIGKIYIKMQ